MDWTHAGPTVLASFMACLVECVEALTVVLAVGAVRGWRSALAGTAAALLALLLLVAACGRSLSLIPLPVVRLVIGTLLLMFGLRWLRKAILRSAGVIALHDEAATYAKETTFMHNQRARFQGTWDKIALAAAFKIVMLEGIEVVFIVMALGADGTLIVPASVGAMAALLLVVLLGFLLHRPLAAIPENALKFGVGVLLAGFGTLWVGEGIHLAWPGEDGTVVALSLAYFALAHLLVWVCRARARRDAPAAVKRTAGVPVDTPLGAALAKLVALFVDDGNLAAGIVIWVLIAWWGVGNVLYAMPALCGLFFAGFAALLAYSAMRARAKKLPAPA